MISIISVIDQNNAIGLNNSLLCHLPNDLKYFKRLTSGHSVIMGWNTFESLPIKPLPNRKNIVLCDFETELPAGCILVSSIEEALQQCSNTGECFVIGGAQVYRQMIPLAQKLYITRVHHAFEADTWFPEIKPNLWQLKSSLNNEPDEKHPYAYSFEVYTRIDSSATPLLINRS